MQYTTDTRYQISNRPSVYHSTIPYLPYLPYLPFPSFDTAPIIPDVDGRYDGHSTTMIPGRGREI